MQLADTLETQFKHREGRWHSSVRWKSCAKFYLLLNIQDATSYSLGKLNLKV